MTVNLDSEPWRLTADHQPRPNRYQNVAPAFTM